MATLRMFANLREIAGTARAEFDGETVARVIEVATEKYGTEFAAGVEVSRIWVNGEEAGLEQPVDDDDEIVLLPPVSGGNRPVAMSSIDAMGLAPFLVAVIAVLASLRGAEIWAAGIVAVVSVWALDLGAAFGARGRSFAPLAVTSTAAAGAIAAHAAGGAGYTLALALAIAVTLGWAVAFPEYRKVDAYAPTAMVALIGGLAAASLVIADSSASPDPSLVGIFLVSVIAGVLFGSIVARMPAIPYLDPITTTAIVAVIGAVVAALLWEADVVSYLLIGIGIAMALVAGRGLSSMLRRGVVSLTEPSPGVMPSLDGVMLAAAILQPLASFIL
ncbi:MAG TPA: MoaD/ThiS family protein [Acidimicrobiia bacterium]